MQFAEGIFIIIIKTYCIYRWNRNQSLFSYYYCNAIWSESTKKKWEFGKEKEKKKERESRKTTLNILYYNNTSNKLG